MNRRFQLIILLIFISLIFACCYQAYWLNNLYTNQFAKMEVDIMTAMKNTDANSGVAPDFATYNDQLQRELIQQYVNLETFSEKIDLNSGKTIQSIPEDTSTINRNNYRQYVFPYDVEGRYAYRLNVRQPNLFILKQMSGILITSSLLIILLFITYYYLLKVIFKQKNLDEIKSDFINNMTHELKTPISVAYAANDALLNYKMAEDPVKREQYLRMSQEQLMHLTGLVEQILTMSVEERKNLQLSLESIHLSDLFLSLKSQYTLHASKDIQIDIDLKPEGLTIEADKVHFRNVMCNLIENAIKYSGEKVRIVLSAEIIRRGTASCIRITVTDNGIGIPAIAIPKLFDKFYRVPSGNIHNTKGYGLGLSYVKTIVGKHGGTIKVESKEGEGSRFEIEIPSNQSMKNNL